MIKNTDINVKTRILILQSINAKHYLAFKLRFDKMATTTKFLTKNVDDKSRRNSTNFLTTTNLDEFLDDDDESRRNSRRKPSPTTNFSTENFHDDEILDGKLWQRKRVTLPLGMSRSCHTDAFRRNSLPRWHSKIQLHPGMQLHPEIFTWPAWLAGGSFTWPT